MQGVERLRTTRVLFFSFFIRTLVPLSSLLIPLDRERDPFDSVTSVPRDSNGRNMPRVSNPKERRDTFGGVCTRYYSW